MQSPSTLQPPSIAGAAPSSLAPVAGSPAVSKSVRLIADQRYFGLDARVLRAGLERALARISGQPGPHPGLDIASLVEDFRLERAAGPPLARLLVAGRLLEPATSGEYRPTPLFREYARATVVAPLSRARARILVEKTCELARQINAEWNRNPFVVRMVAVSGSYMSRRRQLPDLCLWVLLRKRRNMSTHRWKRPIANAEALRQILAAINAQSSFIVVRIVADKGAVRRPFCVVFESGDRFVVEPVHAWERFRDWGASISRRLVARKGQAYDREGLPGP